MSDIVERLQRKVFRGPTMEAVHTKTLEWEAADTIIRLTAEVAEYKSSFDAAWEADMRGVRMWREAHPGNDMVLPDRADFTSWILAEIMRLRSLTVVQETLIRKSEAENKRLRAALKQAGTGLKAGLFQYAAHDFHGNIIPGDEQYPWIRAMQIGLDAVTAALPPPPALTGDKQ